MAQMLVVLMVSVTHVMISNVHTHAHHYFCLKVEQNVIITLLICFVRINVIRHCIILHILLVVRLLYVS